MATTQEIYDHLWGNIVELMIREVEKPGMNMRKLAQKLDVPYSSVHRWIKGERGQNVSLLQTLNILNMLTIAPTDIPAKVSPITTMGLLSIIEKDPDIIEKTVKVIEAGDRKAIAKLRAELDFLQDTN